MSPYARYGEECDKYNEVYLFLKYGDKPKRYTPETEFNFKQWKKRLTGVYRLSND